MATNPPKPTVNTAPSSSPSLSSLYIYNPVLGKTDETVHEQLVFHYSLDTKGGPSSGEFPSKSPNLHRELRATGLAQGIIEFARAFSPNAPLREIRTHKGFSVALEAEKNWWILATVELPSPAPLDLITPSILRTLLQQTYRIHRLKYRTFQYLYRSYSLEFLVSTVSPHYREFASKLNLTLSEKGAEIDFDAIRWSAKLLDESSRQALARWVRNLKSENPSIIDVLLFRDGSAPRASYEPRLDGLLFPGLQDGDISTETVRDLSLFMTSRDCQLTSDQKAAINEINGKRSVSLPGFSESWESVVQTSSNLFSALSFGTLPARRSPLSMVPTELGTGYDTRDSKKNEGHWVHGGENKRLNIWMEASAPKMVPISLGDQRPEFMREHSDQGITSCVDGLIEVELSLYKVHDFCMLFLTCPSAELPICEPFPVPLEEVQSLSTARPPTPQSLKPFVLVFDPLTLRLYSTIPPIPQVPSSNSQPFSLGSRRPLKRDLWSYEQALDVHSHLLRLRSYYTHSSTSHAREFTVKTSSYFFFRTLLHSDDRSWGDFAEGWYIVKTGATQTTGTGLGRGDDAGGLEDIAREGKIRCREIWRLLNVQDYTRDSDDE